METEIVPGTREGIERAAQQLREGQPVALPTETVYGLAAPALDADAVTRIFQTKERPSFDPLIVHVQGGNLENLGAQGLVDVSRLEPSAIERANHLIQEFWPGPLTLVVPVGDAVPGVVTSGLNTVALRAPRHPVFQSVLAELGAPLSAPSANRFGRISPTRATDVLEELEGRIGLIVDGGPCEVGVESTVVRVEPDGSLTLLRAGGTPKEAIEASAGCTLGTPAANDKSAPGRMKSHYAPRKPFRLLPRNIEGVTADEARELLDGSPGGPVGVLLFDEPLSDAWRENLASLFDREVEVVVASCGGDDAEAARNLFHFMRQLDRGTAVAFFAEPILHTGGLWPALAERLEKAIH